MTNPITKVYLLDVPLENDYKNTLYFPNKSAQQTYFQSKVINSYSYNDFTYQRKDQVIRIPELYDNICNCNYVMYQNSNYSNKWFYAFVTDLEYINDGRTDLHIETDVMQTWMFDFQVKSSFVEREHVSDDTIGINTVPEQLETGDYINQPPDEPSGSSSTSLNYLNDNLYAVIGTSDIVMQVASPSPNYNGVFSGVTYIAFPTFADARSYITYIQGQVATDPIVTMFMSPLKLIQGTSGSFSWLTFSDGSTSFQYGFVEPSNLSIELKSASITKPNSLDGYTPRNKKLLTYPYQFLDISNNAGSNNVYQYELFKGIGTSSSTTCDFSVRGAIGTGCSIQCIPINYNKTSNSAWNYNFDNFEEGLDAPKLPTCSWWNDAYTNWLTQNAVNIGVGFAENIISMGTGGAIEGGLGIAGTIGEIYAHSKVPNTAKGGINQGDLLFASKRSFSIYKKCIKKEFAQIIDKYFDMYGYKVNMVKVPNSNHRSKYWYTKTINVNINGNIPQKDMQKIKSCYNNGITFWRNASEIEDYSVNNSIL